MRILHLPANVGGNAWGLVQGERQIDLSSRALCLFGSPYGFPADIDYHLETRGRLGRAIGRLEAFMRVRKGFDVYHFNFGSTLLHLPWWGLTMPDLPFYDSRAKKIFTWQGCDARQKFPTMARNESLGCSTAACFVEDCYGGMCNSGDKDKERRRAIDKASRHADHMFAVNPDLLYFLPSEISSFLPYSIADFDSLPARQRPLFGDEVVRIGHAPTERGAKGTALILKALKELREDYGDRVQIVLIEGVPRARALQLYADCDLVIDQLLIGWYGAVAVEAMKMGVPVASFVNEDHLQFVPAEMAAEIPLLRIDMFTVKESVRRFIEQRDMAMDLIAKGRAFVDRWHKPARVARRTAAVYGAASASTVEATAGGVTIAP